jgi:hypothetical protein
LQAAAAAAVILSKSSDELGWEERDEARICVFADGVFRSGSHGSEAIGGKLQ